MDDAKSEILKIHNEAHFKTGKIFKIICRKFYGITRDFVKKP